MKDFIKKTLYFFLPILILYIGSYIFLINHIRDKNHFLIQKNVHSIILGHSHSACAFDDKIIKGFYNLSQNTEGYPYSYYKAKAILENNKHIKNIFVEYTNNQISPWSANRIYGIYMSNNMQRMLPLLDVKFIFKTFYDSKNITEISNSIFKSYKKNIDFIFTENKNFIEHFWHTYNTPTHKLNADTIIKKQNKNDFINIIDFQEENIKYLFKIKQLCKTHNVNLYLIRSPLPKHETKGYVNEPTFMLIKEAYFPEITFLDFRDFPLNLSCFADNQHLNIEGRKIFSSWFEFLINERLLEKNDKQKFINSEMIKVKPY